MRADHILAIDQGTTSTRALLFDSSAQPVVSAQRELKQHYPAAGWVEHDPEDIWQDVLAVCREAVDKSELDFGRIAAIGIANQRETVVVWDRSTGKPIHHAIVWQDRRTAEACEQYKWDGVEPEVRSKTGLLLDPYFSATKLAWILDTVEGARARAERGELLAGTIDTFVLWRLTGGAAHATDVTNASRTLLFDIHKGRWETDLCRLFRIPEALLPEVCDNSHIFGVTASSLFGREIAVGGMAGDQQAALFGQACFRPGMVKSTYGTGCFMLVNTGAEAVLSKHRLLTTPAYRIQGTTTYALEGSIFVAGAAVKWLRDGLGIIAHASDTDGMVGQVAHRHGVYMVPAFVGLGAPHWEPNARAAIFGLTLDATAAHLARAALEAVAFQTRDLIDAMVADGCATPAAMRVDGGMITNNWLCQFLADISGVRVERPASVETTALGAAFHAGLATGVWSGMDEISRIWVSSDRFEPSMDEDLSAILRAGWADALRRTISQP